MPSATLALLPFENLSGNPGDERLARGFLYDLSVELARFPSLGVLAADSVAAAMEENNAGIHIAERLGAAYFLKGGVRRWNDALRISVQLCETSTGRHIWAGRYDGADLPSAHDEIVASVANALAAGVDASILAAARRRSPPSLQSYECWLRGMECLQRGTAGSDEQGRQFFQQALEMDPHDARAHAGLSLSYFNDWSCQSWGRWEVTEQKALEHALQAEKLDPDNAMVQMILARIEQYRRNFDRAAPRLRRAQELAPNDANILIQLAVYHTFDGNASLGAEFARRTLQLNPLPPGWVYCYAAVPFFTLREYKEMLHIAGKAPPGLIVDTPAYKAAASAYLGDSARAERFLEEFREDYECRIAQGRKPMPGELLRWILHVNPYRRDEDTAHLEEGLDRAGLEGGGKRSAPPVTWPVANIFRREGGVWTLSFEHEVVRMPEMKGFHDIARLLAKPGCEISCIDMMGAAVKTEGLEVTDTRALKEYRGRLAELKEEIAEASAAGNVRKVEEAEQERETIMAELRAVSGLGGRVRRTGATQERARSAVTWRIRSAIKKIHTGHPRLGRHLENTIRTGTFCSYQPEKKTTWMV